MNEDLPDIRLSGYWREGEGDNAKRFVTTKNAQGRGSIVEVGAETQDGYKILDYDEENNIAVLEKNGFKYRVPQQKSVILDSTKSNPYNPSWNNTQSQYSDALSFNDLQGLAKFGKEQETFNSMIEDATGMPLYQIKEAQGRMMAEKMLSDYKQKKAAYGFSGALSSQEEQMLNFHSYHLDPTQDPAFEDWKKMVNARNSNDPNMRSPIGQAHDRVQSEISEGLNKNLFDRPIE